ncbi:hypothetical protein [Nodosilinea nodulosa]|uniref:hypothetical protein n=1 Tax=Nodosilinea nodulosa TaxID=416001 RepID=UPI00037B14F0|nr:hypothetical protein [Nodosilinea nodulosa]
MPKIPELESPNIQIAENFYGKLLDLHLEVEGYLRSPTSEGWQEIKAMSDECRKLRDYHLGTRYQ